MIENSFKICQNTKHECTGTLFLNGFVFVYCDQILLDFDIQFSLPRDIFLNKWNKVKGNIKQVHSSNGFDSNEIPAEFGEDIEPMLLLLQMLPDVPKGKKSSKNRLTFVESVKKLVVFSPVII